jgi:pantetheine-phosphate adenylyltransferase
MKVAIYPGSFDPVTLGHLDVIRRSCAVFDRLVVGVLENARKSPSIAAATRADILRAALGDELGALGDRVEVTTFGGLTVELARRSGAGFIVRGLRAVSDFESELQMAHLNRKLAPEVDTVFLMTGLEHAYLSSSMVREIAAFGGDVSGLVPRAVLEHLEGARGPDD